MVNQDPKVAEINRLNKLIQELRLALMNQELGITCPKEHEELDEKCNTLQQKLRDMTEKLNSNLAEVVVMHERAEMAEQAREKIKSAMALVLDEFEQVFQDFNICNEIDIEKHNKLKVIYTKLQGKFFSLITCIILNFSSHLIPLDNSLISRLFYACRDSK